MNLNFEINGCTLEIYEKYSSPVGLFIAAQSELYTKACKAWFSISNIIYQDKKMPANHSCHASQAILVMSNSTFKKPLSVLRAWEDFPAQKI